jgi:AcrR family transcriptional regulator
VAEQASEQAEQVAGRYHHGSLRSALLDEAVEQVRERGADKVSLRALAGAVGVSPSAAYQHFPDKDALLLAVGEWGFGVLSEQMQAGVDAVPGDDDEAAIAKLRAVGSAYIGFATTEPHLFRLMFGPLCRKPNDGEGDDGGGYAILEHHLGELDRRGLLRAPDDEALHLLIWSVVHGFASLAIEGQVAPEAGTLIFNTLRTLLLKTPPQR